jgi:diguanylate cyclase (GGDEF)-like protein
MAKRPHPVDGKLLSDYADITVAMFPRTRAVSFFDAAATVLWSRGPAPPPPLQAAVMRVLSGGVTGGVVTVPLGGSLAAYVLPAIVDQKPVGACSVVIAGGSGKNEPAPPSNQVGQMLGPVMNLLGRSLVEARGTADPATASPRAPAAASGDEGGDGEDATLSDRTRELEWLIDLTADQGGGADNNAILTRVLRAAIERMGCTLSAVLMPDRQVNLVVHAGNAADSDAHRLLARLRASLLHATFEQQRVVVVNQLADRAGERMPFKVIAVPVLGGSGKVSGVLVFLRPVEKSNFERRHLYLCKHLSSQVATLLARRFDLATGLHTRSALETYIRELAASNPKAGRGTLLHIDMDQLHLVNDRFGFDRGDELIVRFAGNLQAPALPADAVAARIGGDQFAVFLPGKTLDEGEVIANGLHSAMHNASVAALPEHVAVTISIGCAEIDENVPDLTRAQALAELACRAAKDRGRNRVECYRDGDNTLARRYADITTVAQLRHALDNDRMTLLAQRIVPLQGQQYEGYELLLRGLDDAGRPFSPGRYLSAAQRYQLLGEVDDWVVRHAFTELGRHRGLLYERRIRLSINVSGPSLMDPAFWERVEALIARSMLAPALVTFEITESVALSNLAKATDLISRLKARGCRFALDDFGIGVNSLSYLKSLPVNIVKIDGSFVRDILTNQRSDATVRAIVTLAREMQIDTVAEYVENPEIRARIAAIGVDYAQGYAIAMPETLDAMLQRVRADSEAAVGQLLAEG